MPNLYRQIGVGGGLCGCQGFASGPFIECRRRPHPQQVDGIALFRPVKNTGLKLSLNEASAFHPVQAAFLMLQAHSRHQVRRHVELRLFLHVECQKIQGTRRQVRRR